MATINNEKAKNLLKIVSKKIDNFYQDQDLETRKFELSVISINLQIINSFLEKIENTINKNDFKSQAGFKDKYDFNALRNRYYKIFSQYKKLKKEFKKEL